MVERVPSEGELAARTLAAENGPNLVLTEDLGLSEVLDGRTGAITSLQQVITGDRPVVLWYWTPN